MTSPLQLEGHHLMEVALRVNPTWVESDEDASHNAVLQVRGETLVVLGDEAHPYTRVNVGTYFVEGEPEDDALAARTLLSLDVNGDDADREATPYGIRVVVMGTFRAYGFPTEGDERAGALQVVRANSAALLYGIARHVVTELTLQSPYRSLSLPSLSFQTVVEREAELEAAADDAPPAPDEPQGETPS